MKIKPIRKLLYYPDKRLYELLDLEAKRLNIPTSQLIRNYLKLQLKKEGYDVNGILISRVRNRYKEES